MSAKQVNSNWWWAVAEWGFLLIFLVCIGGGVAWGWQIGSVMPVLLGGIFAVVVFPWYRSAQTHDIDVFDPLVFKSVFVFMIGILLLNRYALSREPFERPVNISYDEGLILITGLYLGYFILLLIGYYGTANMLKNRNFVTTLSMRLFRTESSQATTVLRWIAVIYVIIGAIGYSLLLLSVVPGTNIFYLYTTTTPRSELFTGEGVLMLLSNGIYIGYFVWLAATISDGNHPSVPTLAAIIPICGLMALLGGRGLIIRIGLVFAMLLYFSYLREFAPANHPLIRWLDARHPFLKYSTLPIAAIFAPILLVAMQAARLNQPPIEAIRSTDLIAILTAGVHDLHIENFLVLLELVPSELGYYYGAFYFRVISNFVPRSIWPEKPVATEGGVIRRIIAPDATGGYPAGEMQSFYINFGLPGIMVGTLVYGALLRVGYEMLYTRRQSMILVLMYALLIAHLVPYGLINNALSALLTDIIWFIPIITVLTWITEENQSLSPYPYPSRDS